MKISSTILILFFVVSIGSVWALGEREDDGKITVVVMPKLVGIPYFNASEIGAKKAGEDLGIEVIYTGPSTADAAEQVRILEDMISKNVDAIAVAPNDPAALTPVLRRAKDAGIVVLDWDTPAEEGVVKYSVQQIDNQEYAQHIWDLLVQDMGDVGDYAIITGGLSAANINNWIDIGLAYANTQYPKLNLVTDKIPSDEKQQIAYQKSLDVLKSYPNLKGIIGMSTPAPLGAAQAVQEKGLQNTVTVVGTALPTDSTPYLKDGSLDTATLWNPQVLGYLTVYVANEVLKGNKINDGQDIPNVGKVTVSGKIIVMGPPTDFTKENSEDFGF